MRRVASYLENSTDLVNTLSKTKLPTNSLLCTLDIESLYTNITHKQAVIAFARRFRAHPKFVFYLDLLKFVLSNNVFQFDGRFFSQRCGIAMGTKLAPALATIVVADFEEKYLAESPPATSPSSASKADTAGNLSVGMSLPRFLHVRTH